MGARCTPCGFRGLIDDAQRKGDQNLLGQLKVRGRSDGLAGYAGKLLIAVTWSHPDAQLQLQLQPPGRSSELTGAAIKAAASASKPSVSTASTRANGSCASTSPGATPPANTLQQRADRVKTPATSRSHPRKPISFSAAVDRSATLSCGKELSPAK